jgi:hypothetical protein
MHRRRAIAVGIRWPAVLVAALAVPVGAAWAQDQPRGEPPAPEAEPPPSTITLDRMDRATRVGAQLGLISADYLDGGFLRFNVHAQYVRRHGGSGFYGQFPIATFNDRAGPDAVAVGAVEVGTYLLPAQTSLVWRMGVAIGNGHEGPGVTAAHLFSANERLTDFLLTAPGYSTLRLSLSTLNEYGAAFFRADFGLDIVINAPANASGLHLRANAAAGLRTTHADVTIELVNFGAFDSGAGFSDSMVHTAAVGLRTRGRHQAQAGLVFPLDAFVRGDVWIVSTGYQFAFN